MKHETPADAVEKNAVAEDRVVTLGKIVGAFGVKGWIKVQSYTQPATNILEYEWWQVGNSSGWTAMRVEDGRETGKGVLAKLAGIETPETARLRIGAQLGVWRSQMPAPAAGEYYWSDLEGLQAVTFDGVALGSIDHFRTTPAGTVVVIRGKQEHWVPFVKERILQVDIAGGRIVLDWPAEL